MKKIITFAIFAFMSLTLLEAQEISKTEKVCRKNKGEGMCAHTDYYLGVIIYYDSEMKPTRYSFGLKAQNSKYECVERSIWIAEGSAQNIYDVMNEIEKFDNSVTENGVTLKKGDYSFTRWNYGILGKEVSVSRDGEEGYHYFKSKDIARIKKKLVKYCKKRGIKLSL